MAAAGEGLGSAAWVRTLQVLGVTAAYMAASSAEVLVVKVLNYDLGVRLVLFTALLMNSYWVLQLPLYLWLRTSERVLTRQQVMAYLLIGCLAAAVTGTRAYGLNALPGSVYVVVSTSDLVFNTVLSRMFLSKRFTMYHYAAVAIALSGIILVATDDAADDACEGSSCTGDYTPGILMAVGSALASAINSVVADKTLSVDKKSFLGVAEVSLFNSMVPFSILWIPMLATSEQEQYGAAFASVRAQDAVAVFVVLCAALGLGKMLDRATKFTLVSMKGAFFYAITDSVRKVLTGLLAIWALGEASTWRKFAALGLASIAMGVYVYGSYTKAQAAKAAKAAEPEGATAALEPLPEGAAAAAACKTLALPEAAGGEMKKPAGAAGGSSRTAHLEVEEDTASVLSTASSESFGSDVAAEESRLLEAGAHDGEAAAAEGDAGRGAEGDTAAPQEHSEDGGGAEEEEGEQEDGTEAAGEGGAEEVPAPEAAEHSASGEDSSSATSADALLGGAEEAEETAEEAADAAGHTAEDA